MTFALKYGPKSERQPRQPRKVVYPVSDGKPMAETDKHVDLMIYAKNALRLFFANATESVYVSGNNFLFYEEGNPKAKVSPDAYVVYGIPMRQRDSYKVWEEGGHTPVAVFEFTSKKTKAEDQVGKFDLYEQVLKVPEYFLFDPTGDYLQPRLKGLRLVGGRYVPIEFIDNRMFSEQLRLEMVVDGADMHFFDPLTGRFLPSLEEADARAEAEAIRANYEAARAEEEARARAEAEAEITLLRAELEELRRRTRG